MRPFLYFDYAATTPCLPAAADVLYKYATEDFANPSSSHLLGQIAAQGVRDARAFFAGTFRVAPEQVIFTSGGTESNNLAILGTALNLCTTNCPPAGLGSLPQNAKAKHLLYSAVEHPAVREAACQLKQLGFEPEEIPVDHEGKIAESKLVSLIRPDTFLVSIHSVNNILGTVYPVEALARACKAVQPHLIFHTDAIQSFGKIPHPVNDTAIDFVSLSGHKIEGPKGVGALIATGPRGFKPLRPLALGGGQEFGSRSGTVSPGLVSAFKVAAEINVIRREKTFHEVKQVRQHFENALKKLGLLHQENNPNGVLVWNSPKDAIPHIVHLSVRNLPASLVYKQLEERRCYISSGSACSAGKQGPDPVLLKTGKSKELSMSGLRISFSYKTSIQDVDQLVDLMRDALETVSITLTGKKLVSPVSPEKANLSASF